MKKFVMGVIGGISLAIFILLACVANLIANSLEDQTVARRWSEEGDVSQISCFFSVNASPDADRIMEFEHSIESALTEASVTLDSENQSARLWVDAYSASGTVALSSDRATVSADAYGIGGDFFLFHPLKLLSGSYFSGNDILTDYCVIDQDVAWQLFGSNDVAGQLVYIGGVPHMVTGVIERPDTKLYRAAGLDGACVFVSYDTLNRYGVDQGINHYELLMPNPVSGFAYNYVKDRLGGDERETEVIENSSRYSLLNRWKRLPEFGTRSMNGKAIIFPYWENIARSKEDTLGILLVFEMIFLLIAVVLFAIILVSAWRNKGWTIREKLRLGRDRLERHMERFRMKRMQK